ncbi:hypothetical protein L2X99_08310 [Microbacterium sp. KUDC0406]|uniref:DUF6541 family protein n=1 Tax=Microbacterium sp. KUDC0406 TaxID=2909588 RepID=UPI001F18A8F7|nr:DUF6541 family protein [Microbacterium sp. KUDC0406]UJP11487.1 hypothetical protein L2X99_08310 [Microbacterium sp. KUDC0406]
MIGAWMLQTPVLLTALFVVFVPGVLAMLAAGLRGLALLAFAPVFSVASTAVLALIFGMIGVPWSPLSWGVGSLAVILLAAALGWMLGNRMPTRTREPHRWLLPVALAAGVLFSAWRLIGYIHDPAGISQTNDDVFHLNAVRYILETADASSLHVNAVIGGHSFYPAAWHGVVSLIVMMSGTTIPVAANILTLVIGAVMWPLGIAWLARVLTGSATVTAYAAVLSGALQTFPLLMFQWGVLFPNALSTALIPAGVALVASLPVLRGGRGVWRDAARGALLVLVAAGSLLLSQPAAFLPWAAISLVWLTFRMLRAGAPVGRGWAIAVLVGIWVVFGGVWWYLAQGTSGSHWPPFRGKSAAVVDVLLNGQVGIPFAFGVSTLMIVGLIVAVRRAPLRWFAVSWLGVSALYVLVASAGRDVFRIDILGAWYADPYRIAALAPVVVIPLAALGADAIVRGAARLLKKDADGARWAVLGLVATTVFMLVVVLLRPVAMPNFRTGGFDDESRYDVTAESYLSIDERALLEKLDEYVEPGARVIGNPSTGMGFGYFFSGVDVYPRTWAPPSSGPWQVLAEGLRDGATDPAVCEALRAYGDPAYVLDFGPGEDEPGRYIMPGMTDFAGQPGFERVTGVGDASLWRITACAQ